MAEKIEAKHYTYDPLSMRNKSHTYDVIGHMVWQPYWIYPKTLKKLFSRKAGQIKGKLHRNVPQGMRVQGCLGIIDVTWFGSHIGFKKNIK